MRGLWRAAVGAAVACALAGSAAAAIVDASFGGNWNGYYNYSSWSVEVVYDTSLATETAWTDKFGALGHQLTWNLGDGPSPVISETVTIYGYKSPTFWMNFDDFTPIPDVVSSITPTIFSIFQSDNIFLIQGYGYAGAQGPPFVNLNLGFIPFDQTGSYGPFGVWADEVNGPGPGSPGGQAFVLSPITLTVLSSGTPEPATWAMMLLGFFGVGAAVRRRRFCAA